MKETVSQFLDRIDMAKLDGEEWIETTPEIINHYNRRGMNGSKYFIFQGIKVCEEGKKEEIQKEELIPIGNRVFGSKEGIIEK